MKLYERKVTTTEAVNVEELLSNPSLFNNYGGPKVELIYSSTDESFRFRSGDIDCEISLEDYILVDMENQAYPCRKSVFHETYELIDEH